MKIARFLLKFSILSVIILAALGVIGALGVTGAYFYYANQLPSVQTLSDVHYQQPLRIYTRDGKLMAKYGAKHREPLEYDQFPPQLVHAFLGAEDNDFFNEPGVDWKGLARAAINLVLTGKRSQGGSTITMQVARNFFLTDAKTYSRKFKEIILALRINHKFAKKQILQLYLNKIYLGERAYGAAAAAKVYYGKNLHDLTLAQMAMIAGLPQAPSSHNPIAAPKQAKRRRDYVLRRMYELNYINKKQYKHALNEPVTAHEQSSPATVRASYVAEMIRSDMVKRFGKKAYSGGYTVISTLDSRRQEAADKAIRDDLLAYEYRHGYRGPEGHIDLKKETDASEWDDQLAATGRASNLVPALVLSVGRKSATVYTQDKGKIKLDWHAMAWARRYKSRNRRGAKPDNAADVVARGDIVRLAPTGNKEHPWKVVNVPRVEGALVSVNPTNGAIEALVGGFDYQQSKFNRVVQGLRQPGSSFKPFIYSAAIHQGMTPATLINDAPVVYNGANGGWRPENYERNFSGPTRLREGLVHSMNLVTIRILRDIGLEYARNYAARFGLPEKQMPKDLSLALGTASFSPLQMVRAYAVFANGGYLVKPYYIRKVTGPDGDVLFQAKPALACDHCANGDQATNAARVITPQNAYIMQSMMHDVIRHGTGRAIISLGRHDLAGKTGTTNKQVDAWFSGYNTKLATSVWVGYDSPTPMGFGETGAHAALPAWKEYMGAALKGVPESAMARPPGLVTVHINPKTGKRAPTGAENAVFETFRKGHVPEVGTNASSTSKESGKSDHSGEWVQQLYY